MKLECVPRKFYGKDIPVLEDRKKLGIQFSWKENIHTLLSTLDPEKIQVNHNHGEVVSEFHVASNQRFIFSLSYSSQCPAVLPQIRTTGLKRMENTIAFWQGWIQKCKYSGLYVEEVKRSALVLKLLTYAPSGAIIAAPVTSLPEQRGGERNWDYRYCLAERCIFYNAGATESGF